MKLATSGNSGVSREQPGLKHFPTTWSFLSEWASGDIIHVASAQHEAPIALRDVILIPTRAGQEIVDICTIFIPSELSHIALDLDATRGNPDPRLVPTPVKPLGGDPSLGLLLTRDLGYGDTCRTDLGLFVCDR